MDLTGKLMENKKKLVASLIASLIPIIVLNTIMIVLRKDYSGILVSNMPVWFMLQGLSGLSMYLSLTIVSARWHTANDYVIQILCAVAYSLSSFSLLQTGSIGQHIVFAVFPMLYASFVKLIEDGRGYLFLFFAVTGILADPLLGMAGLAVCFVIALWVHFYRQMPNDHIGKTVAYMMSGLFLTAPLWIGKFWQAVFFDHSIVWDNPKIYQDWLTFVSRFFMLSDASVQIGTDHGANLYCGFFVVFLCFIYMNSKTLSAKKRIENAFFAVFLGLLINTRTIYNLFTFFSDKNAVAVRLSYIAVYFLLLQMSGIKSEDIFAFSYKRIICLYAVLVAIFLGISSFAKGYRNSRSIFTMMILLTGYMLLLFFYRRKSIQQKTYVFVLVLMAFVELLFSCVEMFRNIKEEPEPFLSYSQEYIGPDVRGETEEQELSFDPFKDRMVEIPSDLTVSSGLPELLVIQYDNGIIALDAHKAPDIYIEYILSYKFEAEQDGILFIRQGGLQKRYGEVKKGEKIVYKSIHSVARSAVEYESFQTCYMTLAEEQAALASLRKETNNRTQLRNKGYLCATIIGIFLAFATFLALLFEKQLKERMKDKLTGLRAIKWRSIPFAAYSFILPFTIMLLACVFAGIEPFGTRSFWHGDGIALTMPSMFQARDQLMKGSLFYSYTIGGGSNLYYFNPVLVLMAWLCVIPRTLLPMVIGYVILIKIALGGTAMYVYLLRKTPVPEKNDMLILGFSTAYALCSYQLCLTSYFFWADILLFLPLIIIAMERMMNEHKGGWYGVLLAIVIILNCYNAMYICFFLALWFFTFSFSGIRDFVRKGVSFALHSLLSVGMGFWVIWATVLSRRFGVYADTDSGFPTFSVFQNFFKSFRQFFLFADPVSGTTESGMANFYCGIFALLLICYGSFAGKKPHRFWYRLSLIFFLVVSSNTSVLDYIWNGFHYQNNMPGRYAFLVVFLIIDLSWDMFQEITEREYSLRAGCMTGVVVLVMTALSAYYGQARMDSTLFTVLFLVGYAICFVRAILKEKETNISFCTIRKGFVLLLFLEVSFNCFFVFREYAAKVDFFRYDAAAELIKNTDPEMAGMDRVAILGSESSNLGENINMPGFGIFNSFVTPQQFRLASSLGMAATNNMIRDCHNLTPASNALGRVKYILVDKYLPGSGIDLDDYELLGDPDGVLVLRNNSVVPEGFLLTEDEMKELDKVEGREEFYNAFSEIITNGSWIFDLAIPMTKAEATEDESVRNVNRSDLSFTVGNSIYENFKETDFRLAIPENGTYYAGGYGYTWLGEYEKGENIEIERITMQPDYLTLLRVDSVALRDILLKLRNRSLTNVSVCDGKIRGSIRSDENGYVCIPIPYEPGWQAFVDGQSAPVREIVNGMLAVKILAGTHQIELRFMPIGLQSGIIVTILCWGVYIFGIMINRMKSAEVAE